MLGPTATFSRHYLKELCIRTPQPILRDQDEDRLRAAAPSPTAKLIGVLLSPLVSITAATWVVAWRSASPLPAILHATLVCGLCAWLPYAYLHRQARAGTIDDVHIVRRTQRVRPLLVTVGSVVTGLVLAVALHAPRPLILLVAVMLTSLCLMLALTLVHKVSFHTGVATGAAGVINAPDSPLWVTALLIAMVVAVCWARVRAGRHSITQVALGLAVGIASASTYWALL